MGNFEFIFACNFKNICMANFKSLLVEKKIKLIQMMLVVQKLKTFRDLETL